ncbi:unnamed protein product [Mesocestoides corti]|uniref:K Homology domain-containing protein n=2 Tax=Mesocestoides corti TaxID=53468 RepID=A0A158QU51_MESCO|nr:unnamed protein product [Mesocestoides corti]
MQGQILQTCIEVAAETFEERVTMKVDVAHTEHSHLIGKGGHCVKAMMLDTQCHIHFPDSNRSPNVLEKSNQVSISGRPLDVERARRCIRQMLPLVYIFTIRNASPNALTFYRTSYVVQLLETKFSVEISYRHFYAFPLSDLIFQNCTQDNYFSSSNTIIVNVRGLAAFSQQVMEATKVLLEHHFGRSAGQANVWMTLDVEPKHQAALLSHTAPRGLAEVLYETTGARVRFSQEHLSAAPLSPLQRRSGFYAPRLCPSPMEPSALSSYQRPEARTMVTISGSVSECFLARQTIMTLLPVTLIAEITNEEGLLLSRLDFRSFKTSHDVSVSLRTKSRQSFRQLLILKTTEANVNSLYSVLGNLRTISRLRGRHVRDLDAKQTPCPAEVPTSPRLNPRVSPSKKATTTRQRLRYPILGRAVAPCADDGQRHSPFFPSLQSGVALDNAETFIRHSDLCSNSPTGWIKHGVLAVP